MRTYFTSISLEPDRDLDAYGKMLMTANLTALKEDFESRKRRAPTSSNPQEYAVGQLASLTWGPTFVPIFNCLLLTTIIFPEIREQTLDVMRWLVSPEGGLPVDGIDLSGTTALAHSISTKPTFDLEIAQILLDAGGDINHRDWYGGTCAHEIVKVWSPEPLAQVTPLEAMTWFVTHGGNVDVDDNDGCSVRQLLGKVPWLVRMREAVKMDDERRKRAGGCAFCGVMPQEGKEALGKCGKCKKVLYCKHPKACNKGDWARHKKECKP